MDNSEKLSLFRKGNSSSTGIADIHSTSSSFGKNNSRISNPIRNFHLSPSFLAYSLPSSGCYDTFNYTTKYPGGDTTSIPYIDMDNVQWWKDDGANPPNPC